MLAQLNDILRIVKVSAIECENTKSGGSLCKHLRCRNSLEQTKTFDITLA